MDFLRNLFVDTNIDFVGKRVGASIFSLICVLASIAAVIFIGPNYGIDFTGGTEITLAFEENVEIQEVRAALTTLGLSDDAIQQIGRADQHQFTIRIQDAEFGAREVREAVESGLREAFGPTAIQETSFSAEVGARLSVTFTPEAMEQHALTPVKVRDGLASLQVASVSTGGEERQFVINLPGLAEQIKTNIQGALGDRQFEVLEIDAVGPKVGADLQRQGIIAILATLVMILIYVGFRFDLAFAPGAILALFHDALVTVGIFVLLQREFNLPMIGALLTIVGYSINDTIVIYDRIRENQERYRRKDFAELINVSLNETLGRTLATSTTTLLAVLAFVFLGGPVIFDFALAMSIGIVLGVYSTVYVAVPLVLVMEDVKPWLARMAGIKLEPRKVTAGDAGDEGARGGPAVDAPREEDEAGPGGLSETEKRRRERNQSVP